MVDDTGIPNKGSHSVGVARQYCGQLGKQDNCQVAVTLLLASDQVSLPIVHRLHLPQPWAEDAARRAHAGVPEEVAFQTKPQIALAQIRAAMEAGVPTAPVLADAGYGVDTAFRDGITELGLAYAVGVQSTTSAWQPGTEPLPAKPWSGRGRPPSLIRCDDQHAPISVKDLALALPKKAWRRTTWREGSNTTLASRFAAVRVRLAHGDNNRSTPRAKEWLLIEWPKDEKQPTNTGSRPCRLTSRDARWLIWSNCAGESNATTRTGNRNLASGTMRVEAGEASTTTRRCASPPTDSLSPSEALCSPPKSSRLQPCKYLRYPQATDPGDLPIRPERHVATSITTLRTSITRQLVQTLARCPCCQRVTQRSKAYDTVRLSADGRAMPDGGFSPTDFDQGGPGVRQDGSLAGFHVTSQAVALIVSHETPMTES